ncbi:MAG: hypothetical protein L6R39_006466 [Caloplaca ligustica]|nr:MAG: hypothetical protein L6R39_006466 [Caloplaca ligustica]
MFKKDQQVRHINRSTVAKKTRHVCKCDASQHGLKGIVRISMLFVSAEDFEHVPDELNKDTPEDFGEVFFVQCSLFTDGNTPDSRPVYGCRGKIYDVQYCAPFCGFLKMGHVHQQRIEAEALRFGDASIRDSALLRVVT